MEEILHQLIWKIYLQGFAYLRWCRISSINSMPIEKAFQRQHETIKQMESNHWLKNEELFLPKCVLSPDSVELRHLASRRRTVVLIHSGAVLLICWVRRVEGKERILSLGGMLRDDTGRKTHVVLRSFEKLADPWLIWSIRKRWYMLILRTCHWNGNGDTSHVIFTHGKIAIERCEIRHPKDQQG